MAERLATARSGALIAFSGDTALHSAYDPSAEAHRYVSSLKLDPSLKAVFLVAPCLGYLLPPLREAAPRARIVSVQCSPFFVESVAAFRSDACWTPGDVLSLTAFLEREVSDSQALASRVVEWRPGTVAFGRVSVECVAAIRAFVAAARANAETVEVFGRRWVRNAFRFLRTVERPCSLVRGSAPVVVVGSGPSLEETAPALRAAREEGRCAVFAAASALPALFAAGVPVDLAVSSDGGGWARCHLMEASRRGVCVAAALVSAFPSSLSAAPSIALADSSPWQTVLLEASGLPAFRSPQRGTVTATTLDLALAATEGKVFLAGLDLAAHDLRTHARPNALDRFREEAADRLHPEYSYAYARRGSVSTENALELYARWFAGRLSGLKDRVAALGRAHPSLDFLPRSEIPAPEAGASAPRLVEYTPLSGGEERAFRAADALREALKTERDAYGGKIGPLAESFLDLTGRNEDLGPAARYELALSFISSIARNTAHG